MALKNNFDHNFEQIFAIEKEICSIRDTTLREKLANLKIFECLHAEKPSPHFLSIAKKSKTVPTTDIIGRDEGGLGSATTHL